MDSYLLKNLNFVFFLKEKKKLNFFNSFFFVIVEIDANFWYFSRII